MRKAYFTSDCFDLHRIHHKKIAPPTSVGWYHPILNSMFVGLKSPFLALLREKNQFRDDFAQPKLVLNRIGAPPFRTQSKMWLPFVPANSSVVLGSIAYITLPLLGRIVIELRSQRL